MEESINNLLEQGAINASQARTALARAGEEGIGAEQEEGEDNKSAARAKKAEAQVQEAQEPDDGSYSF